MRKLSSSLPIVVFLVLALGAAAGSAATIIVRGDGSGDFTTIQPALDAAASGDTIRIGPGEYVESAPAPVPGRSSEVDVCAFVRCADLTIIGAGVAETFLGPQGRSGSSPAGIVGLDGSSLRIRGVTLRNCRDGIRVAGAPVLVRDCRFLDNDDGIVWATSGGGGLISSCLFQATLPGSPRAVSFSGGGRDIAVEDCLFDGCGVQVGGLDDCTIRRSAVRNTAVGIAVDGGARCIVADCHVSRCDSIGVAIAGAGSSCVINDSEIAAGTAVSVGSFCTLAASNSAFAGGVGAAVEFRDAIGPSIRHCNLLHGEGPTIRSFCERRLGEITYDLRSNYWGTTDAEEIRSSILDGVGDPENSSTILFEPFVGEALPTDPSVWEQLRALVR